MSGAIGRLQEQKGYVCSRLEHLSAERSRVKARYEGAVGRIDEEYMELWAELLELERAIGILEQALLADGKETT